VDISRDGSLSIDLHRAGMLTLKRWYGSQGQNHETELREYVREYALKIKICQEVGQEFGMTLDPEKVFAPLPGQSVPQSAANSDPANDPNFSDPENIQQIRQAA